MIVHARMLDYEMEQVHTLTIEATDQAIPSNLLTLKAVDDIGINARTSYTQV